MNEDGQPTEMDKNKRPPDHEERNRSDERFVSPKNDVPPTGVGPTEPDVEANELAARVIDLGAAIGPDLLDQIARLDMGERDPSVSEDTAPSKLANMDDNMSDQLEEIAEDMLNLMRRMNSIEKSLQNVVTGIQQVQETTAQMGKTIAREVDALRRDLIGDRKHTAAIGLFNELIPMIDRLRTMQAHLDEEDDIRMNSQLEGVLETLTASLQRLGCEEFSVAPSDAFDPARMQCEAYVQAGRPGVVLDIIRPGYLFGDHVLRPTTVTVGAATVAENDHTGENSDE